MSYATASINRSQCEGLAPDPVVVATVSPWDLQTVTLSKREHVELINQCNYWKSSHQRALGRLQWADERLRVERHQAEQTVQALRAQMLVAGERHRQALEHAG